MEPLHGVASLEPMLALLSQVILNFSFPSILGLASLFARFMLKLGHKSRLPGTISIRRISPIIEEICLLSDFREAPPSSQSDVDNLAILYINGGAFTLRDSADIFLSERLLPLLASRLGGVERVPRIYSILYDVSPSSKRPTYNTAQQQILEGYQQLRTMGKTVVAIMGDSAGGNLALALTTTLSRKPKSLVGLGKKLPVCVLISPWVDLFSMQYPIRHNDFVGLHWLNASRSLYLGHHNSKAMQQEVLQWHSHLPSRILSALSMRGIKVLVFDMDQCMVSAHSQGGLRRHKLAWFLGCISRDFIVLARAARDHGFKLAVATHSDAAEYSSGLGVAVPDDIIVGEELARAVLASALPDLAPAIHVVAFNPRARGASDPKDAAKKHHLGAIAAHYGVSTKQCILFDDLTDNCNDTDGLFASLKVDPREGFRMATVAELLAPEPTDGLNLHWADGRTVDMSQVCPLHMSEEDLRLLPPSLIIAGEREVFYKDIVSFARRLQAVQPHSKLVIGGNDVHAYPVFWQHPMHRLLGSRMFGWFYNQRRAVSEQLQGGKTEHAPVHSPNADYALAEIASFLAQRIFEE